MSPPLPPERLLAIIATQNQVAAAGLDLDSTMSLVAEQARILTGAASAVVELVEGPLMVYRTGRGPATDHAELRLPVDRSLSGLCLRERRTLRCDDARNDPRMDAAIERPGALSMLCAPLAEPSAHDQRAAGVLKVYDPRPHLFSDDDDATIELLAGVIGAHLCRDRQLGTQQGVSRYDTLTRLPDKDAFDQRLAHEFVRIRRRGGKLCVCKLDLDGFRGLNDSRGRVAGDAVLRGVARHLDQVRGDDQSYRVGGDQFATILLGTDQAGAEGALRRVIYEIERDPQSLGTTVSWGIAFARRREVPQTLVARADEALREMKRARARLRDAG
jgi:diguanylate cyclase (GGDEF)-like protein